MEIVTLIYISNQSLTFHHFFNQQQSTSSMMVIDQQHSTWSNKSLELLQREIESLDNHQYLQRTQFIALVQQTEAGLLDPQNKIDRIVPTLIDNLIAKLKILVSSCLEEAGEFHETLKEMQIKLEQKNEQISGLNDTIELLNLKLTNWQHQYDVLKAEATEAQELYDRRLKELKRQKRQIKQTFRMVQENTALERQLLENLQLEKQEIHEQAQSQKKEKQELLEQLVQIKQKLSQSEKELIVSTTKMSWEEKRITKLEDVIEQKNRLVDRLMLQLKESLPFMKSMSDTSMVQRKLMEDSDYPYSPERSEAEEKKMSFIEMFKLSDEIQSYNMNEGDSANFKVEQPRQLVEDQRYMKPFEENELNRSSVLDSESLDLVNMETGIKEAQPVYPDLYFAHFILTAQTMKLKLNREQFLMIDIKPYYPQILKERVPFHMWDEWITKKLKEVSLM